MADSPGLFTIGPFFKSPLTIDHTQVPSTQSDFPVLVNFTDNRFKTFDNGGHVGNSNGYDIQFYSDVGLATRLSYELDRYNASTGEIIFWVKIPSVSSVSDTVFYVKYGDRGISTNGSTTNTWSNSFFAVYHLGNGTTLSVKDSTGVNDGVNTNGVTAAAGQIDGAGSFSHASNQYVFIQNTILQPTAVSHTAWVKATTLPSDYNDVTNRGGDGDRTSIYVKSTGKLYCTVRATAAVSYDGTGSHTLSTGTWYYLALTYDSSAGLIGYVNAASDATVAANGAVETSAQVVNIGRQIATNSRSWDGLIDEVRFSSVARSADWITCEYNNQKTSSTFVSLGTETGA